MSRMTYCPSDCPNRALHCHHECQHYLKAYVLHTLTDKRTARRASDERAFHAEESARVALYVVEDISGTHTDPYHYKLYFHTDVLPDIEVKP